MGFSYSILSSSLQLLPREMFVRVSSFSDLEEYFDNTVKSTLPKLSVVWSIILLVLGSVNSLISYTQSWRLICLRIFRSRLRLSSLIIFLEWSNLNKSAVFGRESRVFCLRTPSTSRTNLILDKSSGVKRRDIFNKRRLCFLN